MIRITCLCVVTLLAVLVFQSSSRSEQFQETSANKRVDINQLSWMKGMWTRQKNNRHMQEFWTEPAGHTMMGIARTIVDDQTVEFEFLRIVQTKPGTIVYFASPGGRCPPTSFELKIIKGEHVVFENLKHDFPQRIIYRRDTDGALHASIEGESNGQTRKLEWSWQPQQSN